jgi:tetratricopeptide (TPR) repeat protein
MALGFGFNKTKVLQAAERNVLQGKLQNAIAEYEKIAKAEPGDLTVANTLGDLYVRVGKLNESLRCFRKVAEAYATNGFMVKAIAMYKKMAKIDPTSVELMQKLAELYGQQGLFSDARGQYGALADLYLRNGDTEAAVNVYRKVLELDPENAGMQQRLAELYRRAGRTSEAADIYVMAGQLLHSRGNFAAAMEAVEKVVSVEPCHEAALLLKAKIATDSGKPAVAMQALESLPGLDQRADALHELLRAAVAAGELTSAEATALKLLRVHNDPTPILEAASAMVAAGDPERALKLVREHVETIATPAAGALATFLNESLSKAKDNVGALETMCELYRMIGERGSSHEASELLAHAYSESGKLAEARQIYRRLAEAEPENPVHHQNYARICSQMGEADTRPVHLAPEDEAVVPEQLPDHEVTVPQQYLAQIEEAIESALTDSDLYQSYNAMPRAIAPLEAVLQKAPEDIRVNQRLAALYVRVERYGDAAARFAVLRTVFEREHLESEAAQCAEMEQKYQARADAKPAAAEFEVTPAEVAPEQAAASAAESAPQMATEWDELVQPHAQTAQAAPAVSEPAVAEAAPQAPPNDIAAQLREILEEARFYQQQGMHREAQAALVRCCELAPDDPAVVALGDELGNPVDAGQQEAQPEQRLELLPYGEDATPEAPAVEEMPPAAAPEITPTAELMASPIAAPASQTAPVAVEAEQQAVTINEVSAVGTAAASQVAAAAAFDIGWQMDDAAKASEAQAKSAAHDDFSIDAIFNEFRADVEKPGVDDMESQYNLGLALKDMGLLDEAIGELQKVCNAVDRGARFAEAVQAYTWLAHCFVERGFPQAAFKWYQKALQLPGLDSEAVVAIHYDLAQAYERAGIKEHALEHFMSAYAGNIDYRDVAERVHSLQG